MRLGGQDNQSKRAGTGPVHDPRLPRGLRFDSVLPIPRAAPQDRAGVPGTPPPAQNLRYAAAMKGQPMAPPQAAPPMAAPSAPAAPGAAPASKLPGGITPGALPQQPIPSAAPPQQLGGGLDLRSLAAQKLGAPGAVYPNPDGTTPAPDMRALAAQKMGGQPMAAPAFKPGTPIPGPQPGPLGVDTSPFASGAPMGSQPLAPALGGGATYKTGDYYERAAAHAQDLADDRAGMFGAATGERFGMAVGEHEAQAARAEQDAADAAAFERHERTGLWGDEARAAINGPPRDQALSAARNAKREHDARTAGDMHRGEFYGSDGQYHKDGSVQPVDLGAEFHATEDGSWKAGDPGEVKSTEVAAPPAGPGNAGNPPTGTSTASSSSTSMGNAGNPSTSEGDWLSQLQKEMILGGDFGIGTDEMKAQMDALGLSAEKNAAAAKLKLSGAMGAAGLGGSGMAVNGLGMIDAEKNSALTTANADMMMENAKLKVEDRINQIQAAIAHFDKIGDRESSEKLATQLLNFQKDQELLNMMWNAPEKVVAFLHANGFESGSLSAFVGDLADAYAKKDFEEMARIIGSVKANEAGNLYYGGQKSDAGQAEALAKAQAQYQSEKDAATNGSGVFYVGDTAVAWKSWEEWAADHGLKPDGTPA